MSADTVRFEILIGGLQIFTAWIVPARRQPPHRSRRQLHPAHALATRQLSQCPAPTHLPEPALRQLLGAFAAILGALYIAEALH